MNTPAPLVSVCMTAYNQEKYLVQAIESVLAQETSFGVELLLGEDCSQDSTPEICRAYAEKYPDRVRVITGPENVGMRANGRRLVDATRGRYIAMCDGDDWWIDPHKLEEQVAVLDADPGCGMCYTRARIWIEAEGRFEGLFPIQNAHVTFEELMRRNTVPNCSSLSRRELLIRFYDEVRPEEKDWRTDDYPMWLWCSLHSRIHFIDHKLTAYRVLPVSDSHFLDCSQYLRYEENIMSIRRWFDDTFCNSSHRRELDRRLFFQGLEILRDAGFRPSRRYWGQQVKAHPRFLFLWEGYHWLIRAYKKTRRDRKKARR